MREGKYVDLVYKFIKTLPDDYDRPHETLLAIADQVAKKHPVWYASFCVRGWIVKGWRWVISKTCGALSKRRGGLRNSAPHGADSSSRS